MNSSLDINQVLELVIDGIIAVTSAERGVVLLVNPVSSALEIRIARNFLGATISPDAFPLSHSILAQVRATTRAVAIADAQGDERFSAMESVVGFQLRSIMCAPLLVRGEVTGVVYVDNRYDPAVFDDIDLELLTAVADQAAIALENAHLYAGIRTRMEEIASLKEYQDNIFSSVSSAVIALSLDGRITAVNRAAAAIFAFDPTTVIGNYYTSALGAEMSFKMLRPIARAVRGGPHYTEQTELRAEVGTRGTVYLNLRVSALMGGGDQQVGIVLVVDDVTERRRLEAARRREETERLRIREIFGRQVADEVVEALLRDSTKLRLGGERATVTVLFADVRGYTALAEHESAEDVVRLLNDSFSVATRHIRQNGGWLDKFIGDAIVAVFNAPLPQSDHADRAVTAALGMQAEMERLHEPNSGASLRFGIGINSGDAIVGNIGSEERMNFTVIGDCVNVAQRLQSIARAGEVLIGETTRRQLTTEPATVRLDPVTVKGRREPVHAYQVPVPPWN